MTIIETIDCIIKGQIAEQKIREDRLKSKDKEIEKYRKLLKDLEEERDKENLEIQKDIDEQNLQIKALREIKLKMQEVSWIGAQGSQN